MSSTRREKDWAIHASCLLDKVAEGHKSRWDHVTYSLFWYKFHFLCSCYLLVLFPHLEFPCSEPTKLMLISISFWWHGFCTNSRSFDNAYDNDLSLRVDDISWNSLKKKKLYVLLKKYLTLLYIHIQSLNGVQDDS